MGGWNGRLERMGGIDGCCGLASYIGGLEGQNGWPKWKDRMSTFNEHVELMYVMIGFI